MLNRFEAGLHKTDLATLMKLARELDVDPADLLRDAQRERTHADMTEASQGGPQQFAHGPKAILLELVEHASPSAIEAAITLLEGFAIGKEKGQLSRQDPQKLRKSSDKT